LIAFVDGHAAIRLSNPKETRVFSAHIAPAQPQKRGVGEACRCRVWRFGQHTPMACCRLKLSGQELQSKEPLPPGRMRTMSTHQTHGEILYLGLSAIAEP
jgi:hypothetical protein